MTVVGVVDALDPSAARGVGGAHPHSPGAAHEAPQDGGGLGPKDDCINGGSGGGGGNHGGEPIDYLWAWTTLIRI